MPYDPSLMHQEEISRLEKLRNQHEEGSMFWLKYNEEIRYHSLEIKSINRFKKGGVKF